MAKRRYIKLSLPVAVALYGIEEYVETKKYTYKDRKPDTPKEKK